MSCSHLSKLGSEILLSRFGQLDPLKTNQISISHLLTERAGTKLLFWQRWTNSYFLFFAFFFIPKHDSQFSSFKIFQSVFSAYVDISFFFSLFFFHQAWMEKDHTHTSWTRHTNNTSVVCWTPKKLCGVPSHSHAPGHAKVATHMWYVALPKHCMVCQLFLLYSFSTLLTTLIFISHVKLLYSTFYLLFFVHIVIFSFSSSCYLLNTHAQR